MIATINGINLAYTDAGHGTPVVLLRGLDLPQTDGSADALIRDRALDLFR